MAPVHSSGKIGLRSSTTRPWVMEHTLSGGQALVSMFRIAVLPVAVTTLVAQAAFHFEEDDHALSLLQLRVNHVPC